MTRREELAANLADVRQRLAAACVGAGRDPAEVTLVAVTKTWPAADVVHLAALGVADVGENRDQEAAPKAAAVAEAGVAVRWHFVGQLQRNKCPSVVGYADLVHSVDSVAAGRRPRGGGAIGSGSGRCAVLVQVSLDGDPDRGGAVPAEVAGGLRGGRRGGRAGLSRGLMAVAPMDWEPARAFAELAEIAASVRARLSRRDASSRPA